MQTAVLDDGQGRVTGEVAYLPPLPDSRNTEQPASAGIPPSSGGASTSPPSAPQDVTRPAQPLSGTSLTQPLPSHSTMRLYLSSLPPQIAKALSVYDTDFDGILGEKDVACASADMEHMQSLAEQEKEGKIPLNFFPDPVRKILNEFDVNGDGDLDVVEIMHGFEALKRERKRKKQLVMMVIGLLIFTVILLGAVGGLMAWVVEANRQTAVGSDAVLSVKNGSSAVQTASVEFQVKNGVMVERDSECIDSTCPSKPLKMTQSLTGGRLTSEVPDEDLEQLRTMKISNGDLSWIFFQVLAVARYPALGESRYGTVVVIYTHLGEITLDGEDLSFHESIQGAFSQAGFQIDRSGRRLLGVVEVLGLFNILASAIDPSIGNFSDAVGFVKGLSTYRATVAKYSMCFGDGPKDGCFFHTGQAVDHAVIMESGDLALLESERQELYSIKDEPYSRTITTKDQYPFQELHTVRNASHKLTFQNYKDVNYRCKLVKDTGLSAATSQQDLNDDGNNGSGNDVEYDVSFLGFTELDGVDGPVRCRHWRISTADAPDLFYFEHYAEERLYQLNYSNTIYRFDEVDFTVEGVSREEVPPEIDIEAIMEACDPEGIKKPFPWKQNEISDARYPEPNWGVRAAENKGPSGKVQFTSMTKEEYDAHFRSLFFNGTVAEYQEYMETDNASAATWCLERSSNRVHDSGMKYTMSHWWRCDESARRTGETGPQTIDISLSLEEGDKCFAGLGTARIERVDSETYITSGSIDFELNVLTCFEDYWPVYMMGAGNRNAAKAQNNGVGKAQIGADVVVSTTALWNQFTEATASCQHADNRIGDLADSIYFRGITQQNLDNLFKSNNGNGREVFTMQADLVLDTLVLAPTKCGSMQEDGGEWASQLGFRFGFEMTGDLIWDLCWHYGLERFVYCSDMDPPGTGIIHSFALSRQIFPPPAPAVDNCRRDADGTYRYLCTNENLECSNPIGMLEIEGEQCDCFVWVPGETCP